MYSKMSVWTSFHVGIMRDLYISNTCVYIVCEGVYLYVYMCMYMLYERTYSA